MNLLITSSAQYTDRVEHIRKDAETRGYTVRVLIIPQMNIELTEIENMRQALDLVKWADEIGILWDTYEIGTPMVFAMAFALDKRVKMRYTEPKRIVNLFQQYAEECKMKLIRKES